MVFVELVVSLVEDDSRRLQQHDEELNTVVGERTTTVSTSVVLQSQQPRTVVPTNT